jgi:DNA (cytosine-5)-methyltransferase 1
MTAVELFAGAGGLALGVSQAGFQHLALIERDRDCIATIRANQQRGTAHVVTWPLVPLAVSDVGYSDIREPVDLLAAGPPCQPFSIGGVHRGSRDPRNLFSEVARAARVLRPRAVVVENVRGLLRPAFNDFLQYVLLQLAHPSVEPRAGEEWTTHLARLARRNKAGDNGLRYHFTVNLVNSTDYGVPQRRERVFLVGFRSDVRSGWTPPKPTHSLDSLLRSQWVTGEYWDRHRVARRRRPKMPDKYGNRVSRIRAWGGAASDRPWATVRDAIADLPDPTKPHLFEVLNHWANPGARRYRKHTGSPLDEPAKTIKAGGNGVPGGENMLALPDGAVRYFTVRECARLQTFPDEFAVAGAWCRAMRQLGNAVPVSLARLVAESVRWWLSGPVVPAARDVGAASGATLGEAAGPRVSRY